VVAYSDNAAVMEGHVQQRFFPVANQGQEVYRARDEVLTHVLMKVETHNHPTAISPFPGASTGAGGEIRDEGATGRGSKPKAGLTGFRSATCARRLWEQNGFWQARPHRQCLADHDRRPAGRRGFQQRVWPAQPQWLLSRVRTNRGRPALGLPQAHHDRRRPGHDSTRS
jgi:phosphoribosylformylglycinamidine (FGAM) synthase-like enzyme